MDKIKIIEINKCIKRIALDNNDAVYDLYNLIGSNIYFVAFKYLGNKHDTDDLIADFWADINKICSKFHFERNGYSFLCKVVKNRALNKLKAEGKKIALSLDNINVYESIDFAQEEKLIDIETKLTVEKALETLTKEEKNIIYLVYWEDKTVRQIAKEMDMSKSQVDRVKQRAVGKMKEVFVKIAWDKQEA